MRAAHKKRVPVYTHWGVSISVYESSKRFSAQFVTNGSERYRIEKATEMLAVQAAKKKIEALLKVDPTAEIEEHRASEIFARHGLSIIEAARLFDKYSRSLSEVGSTIADAVSCFLKQHSGEDATVEMIIEELIRSKERDTGLHHVSDLICRLRNRFGRDFAGRQIRSISGPDIARWLDALPLSSRSRRNYHSAVVGLFKFAKERGYLPDNLLTAPEKVRKPKAGRVLRQIYSPDELEQLITAGLKINSGGLIPLVIQAFAGVRTEELCQSDPNKDRLRWEDIQLDQDDPELHIRSDVSKTGEERFVYLAPCLRAWLRVLQKSSSGPVYPGKFICKDYAAITTAAGIPWKKNALRKSFNTYHTALSGSLADTATEAGNSEQMVRQYYRKTISQAGRIAREWFSLGPELFIKAESQDKSAA